MTPLDHTDPQTESTSASPRTSAASAFTTTVSRAGGPPAGRPAGVVRRNGTQVVDGAGERALFRGVGIGTWLLPEGYMWRLPHVDPAAGSGVPAQSPREIEALVARLVGDERAAAFWAGFREAFFTRSDVDRIAAEGFDHVRLPINARVVMDDDGTFLEEGLALVDACVGWCREAGLHVVLDLHGAPGGQTGTNIDDSPRGRPELFTDERYRALTVRLWTEIARRYAGDETVAAYDLLNEPLPDEHAVRHRDDLVALYRDLTAAVRAVDPDHLIMYEGTHWASDVSIFTEVWDERSVIQFHRYWAAPDLDGIATFLEVRDRLGLPLYMGEGGENAPSWLATAFGLYEGQGIGWNFWTWKKLDNPHSPAVVVPPAGWADVQAFVAGTGPQPAPEDAWETLVALVDAMRLERCEWHPEVVAALLRRTPVELPAYAYGTHGEGVSWETSARSSDAPGARAGGAPPAAPGSFRADDGVTVERHGGEEGANPFAADPAERARAGRLWVLLQDGDSVAYDVSLGEATLAAGRLAVTLDVCPADGVGAADRAVQVSIDGVEVPGGWSGDTWSGATRALPQGTATPVGGQSRVTVRCVGDDLRLGAVTLT
ncbi:endoglucanase [Sanguibacter keddieii DSM 10542]|uniref:Endoglucanase n=1 Tax=Sanguibacter keddieii (strain ATCC 51767 / DSM 10542 / NCFB 3025 / ST-74) TaxID=446469 RepID=D1BAI0_SANKS|nr:cellulase family glycosylhydrolase [Sanguibacter keddieii]ACZ20531.1 endoglucanase [Sanguibacter keddieii DSM 10542]